MTHAKGGFRLWRKIQRQRRRLEGGQRRGPQTLLSRPVAHLWGRVLLPGPCPRCCVPPSKYNPSTLFLTPTASPPGAPPDRGSALLPMVACPTQTSGGAPWAPCLQPRAGLAASCCSAGRNWLRVPQVCCVSFLKVMPLPNSLLHQVPPGSQVWGQPSLPRPAPGPLTVQPPTKYKQALP